MTTPRKDAVTAARELLAAAAATPRGRAALRDLGYGDVIDAPEPGDEGSTIQIARDLSTELVRRYKL